MSFFVEDLAHASGAQNELFDWISRHLAASGIALAANQSQPAWMPPAVAPEPAKPAAERAFDLVMILAGLTAEERRALAAKAKTAHWDEGAVLVDQGRVMH